MPLQKRLDCLQGVVEQVLVVDLVKGQILNNALHVKELNDKHSVIGQQQFDAICNRMEILKMENIPAALITSNLRPSLAATSQSKNM